MRVLESLRVTLSRHPTSDAILLPLFGAILTIRKQRRGGSELCDLGEEVVGSESQLAKSRLGRAARKMPALSLSPATLDRPL